MSDADKATGGPAEAAQSASSSPPAKDASTTPANGDGGDNGKGGKGGKGGNGAGDGGDSSTTRSGAIRQFVMNLAPVVVFALVALAIVLSLVSIFWPYITTAPKLDKTLLQLLADTETARGLITFLVALTTVGIAFILIVYLATSSTPTDQLKERFAFSKEVLTSLIGILGTIIGFYFGASQDQTHSHGTPPTLTLANLAITPPKPVTGGTVKLDATLSGGQPPYHYVIRFTQDGIKKIESDSPSGTIGETIKLDAYDQKQPLDITLEGTDATGTFSGKLLHLAATP